MRLLLVILAGLCIGLAVERQQLTEENERAAARSQANRGNWIQDRIKSSPRMLDEKPKSANRRSRYMGATLVQPACSVEP